MTRSLPYQFGWGHVTVYPLPRSIQKLKRRVHHAARSIIEQSSEAAAASNLPGAISEIDLRKKEHITDALMVSLAVVMRNELPNGDPQRTLSEQNHALQTGYLLPKASIIVLRGKLTD